MSKNKITGLALPVFDSELGPVGVVVVYRKFLQAKPYKSARAYRHGLKLAEMLADRADWERFVAMMERGGWVILPADRWYHGVDFHHPRIDAVYSPEFGHCSIWNGELSEPGTWRQLLAAGMTPDQITEAQND